MRSVLRSFLFFAIATAAYAAPAVEGPWVRLVPGKENAAGYLTFVAPTDDRLTGVSSTCCERVEIHEMTEENGVMRMREVSGVDLPASMPVAFAPMGYHLMLIGLKTPPADGARIPIMLEYKSGAKETVSFPVKLIGGSAGGHTGHH